MPVIGREGRMGGRNKPVKSKEGIIETSNLLWSLRNTDDDLDLQWASQVVRGQSCDTEALICEI